MSVGDDQVKVEDPVPLPELIKQENGHVSPVSISLKMESSGLFSSDSPPPKLPSPRPKSRSPSPEVKVAGKREKEKKDVPPPPQIIDHLPVAWEEAHETFDTLERCVYERKDLGLSREQDEMMICDCVYEKREYNKACLSSFVGGVNGAAQGLQERLLKLTIFSLLVQTIPMRPLVVLIRTVSIELFSSNVWQTSAGQRPSAGIRGELLIRSLAP